MTTFFGAVDLAGSWTTAWTAILGPLGNFSKLMAVGGTLMVVVGLFMYLWERRRSGGGGNHQKLIYTIIVGAILSAPGVMIPVLLTFVDYLVNAIISLLQSASGTGGTPTG
jgi:hypothetical protein